MRPAPRAGHRRPQTPRLSSPTVVGRAAEVGLLCELVVSPPALALVEGAAGIGKSRLVREVVCHPSFEGRRLLHGYAHRLRDPFLLGPIVEALRRAGDQPLEHALSPLAGTLRPLLPELADMLPPALDPTGDARAERHRLFRALRELLDALGPTLCVLEDLHWADEGTLEFLAFLLSDPPRGLAAILTYRGEDLPATSPVRGLASRLPAETPNLAVALAPLSVEEVRCVVAAILQADVSDGFASDLHGWTAGNPFAIEEVIRMLREQDRLVMHDGRLMSRPGHVGVPPTIADAVRERLAALGRDSRHVACSAAVLATTVDEDLLVHVAGLPAGRATTAIAEAVSSGLLEKGLDARLGFHHVLAAEAVYADIPIPERRRLHLRAGKALEAGPEPRPLARLAHHFKEAQQSPRWTRYAEAAADAAIASGNDREAARLLEDALGAEDLSRAARIRMALKLGRAALYSASPRAAIQIIERTVAEQEIARGARGELRLTLSRLRSHAGDPAWRDETIQAVGELALRPELAATAMTSLAWPTMSDGPLEEDLDWLARAMQTSARVEDAQIKQSVALQRAAILLSIGDPGGWESLRGISEHTHSAAEKAQLLRGYQTLAVVTLGLGYNARAQSFLDDASRVASELEHMSWGLWLNSTRIGIDWRVGRWEGLESRARELMDPTLGRPALSLGNELILGALLLARGQTDKAEQVFSGALEFARPRNWLSAQIAASTALARIHFARGDVDGAAQLAAIGLSIVRRKGIWAWARDLAPVAVANLLACGRSEQARKLSEEFRAGLADRDAPAARAASTFCQGAVAQADGHHASAERVLSRAERLWRELRCPYEAAHARERRAHCLLRQDDRRGGELLLGALEAFDDLGASWDAARVRAELRTQGVAPRASMLVEGMAYEDGLSPREAEVARLAGMGKKNREIADALFLSPRTVEAHVASALRKLGCDSRRALAPLVRATPVKAR